MRSYAGVDYNSPYLIVKSVVSYPTPPQRERGGFVKIFPFGLAHSYLSANFQTTNRKRRIKEKGEERGKG